MDTLRSLWTTVVDAADDKAFKESLKTCCASFKVRLPAVTDELKMEQQYARKQMKVSDEQGELAGIIVRREYCSNRLVIYDDDYPAGV